MTTQARAFQISFLIHSVLIALAVMFAPFQAQDRKTIVLDFHLLPAAPAIKNIETPMPFITAEPVKPAGRPSLGEKETPARTKEAHRMPPVAEKPAPAEIQEVGHIEMSPTPADAAEPGKTSTVADLGIAGGTKEGPGTMTGAGHTNVDQESAGTSYLNENFAYIRDKILRNVIYPDAARRMGWQGKVVLSFIITANGSVKSFRIIQSSGFKMLDMNAIETVRDTAPFPRPPVEAKLVIPIVYRLNEQ